MQKLLFLILLLSTACIDTTPPEDPGNPEPFFDLSDYMDEQIEQWQTLPRVTKSAYINGEESTRVLSNLDFKEELAVFGRADINRPAWIDRYAVDSTRRADGSIVWSHRALDEDLKTRRLDIYKKNGTVTRIEIENQTDGPVAATYQFLTYEPLQRYEIRSTQEVVLMDSTVLRVVVTAGPGI